MDEVAQHRAQKDAFMRSHHSPIPADVRSGFIGLNYYPPDPAYVVDATLTPDDSDATLEVERTGGDSVVYDRVGRLDFMLPTGPARLDLFERDGHYWLPLRDATSGPETYGAGRYLDVDDPTFLDFNLLYNPFCAYSERYSCPLVPPSNVLAVPVRVGERNPE